MHFLRCFLHQQGERVPYGSASPNATSTVKDRAAPSQVVPCMTATEAERVRPLHERRNALSDSPKTKVKGLDLAPGRPAALLSDAAGLYAGA